jgi:hypothetical protein
MFARTAIRVAARQTIRPTTKFAPVISRSFQHSSKKDDPEVNVIHYQQGQRQEEHLPVPPTTGPVTPPGEDIDRPAQPFNHSILSQLTPTMAKFTLPGKVAIVTGSVSACLYQLEALAN